jgi:hypothetical protein
LTNIKAKQDKVHILGNFGNTFPDPYWSGPEVLQHQNNYLYPLYILTLNWYYCVYEFDKGEPILFSYFFHGQINPFEDNEDDSFSISRRCKIDITSNPIKDSLYKFRNDRTLFVDKETLSDKFKLEILWLSCWLYRKHSIGIDNENMIFNYDSYVIIMHTCPRVKQKKIKRQLIVIEEDGRWRTRGRYPHGLVKIYYTDLSFLRL